MHYNAPMPSEPRILLHGWGMSPDVLAPLVDSWGRDSVVVPALPGYPGSSWSGASEFAVQVETMGSNLAAGHLIGWSLGGLYAIELARLYPQKFARVTLLACNPCFVSRPDWECGVDAAIFDAFSADLARDWRRTLRRFLALQVQGEAEARQLARSLGEMVVARGEPDSATLAYGLELLQTQDARPSLAQLSAETSLILGERDRLVPIGLAQQIREVAPRIRVESVAGAAHAPFLSHTAEVVALIDRDR